MRKSTIAIGIAAALSTQAFVTTTNADAAVKVKPQKSNPNVSHQLPRFVFPHHSPNGGGVLFDQSGSAVNGAPSQNFSSSYDSYDAQGADDFVVTDAAGWTLSGFNFQTSLSTSPPGDPTTATYDIEIFPDAGGVPGASATCSYPALPGTVDPSGTSLSVSLSSPCNLAQGTYWVEMVVNLDFVVGGQMFWSDFAGGSGSNSKWQNPGDAFGTGCTSWSDLADCGSPAVGGGQTAFLFQVLGTVGGGPSCGAGQLCLTATVGTDTSPTACATTDTIDATVGDQLNFCYVISNNTGIELDYHTLTNNVDGTLFSLLNEPVPNGGTFQYNNIESVNATATYNSTWTAQDVPPGYSSKVTSGGGGCPDRIFSDGFEGTPIPCGSGFIDITGTGTPLNNGDDQAVAVTMPFSFNFYGTTANQICVDNNGFVLFNTTACPSFGLFTNVSLPASTLSAPALMPMWDDFDSESGNVYTDTRGSSPDRQFIVEWFDRVHYNGSTNTDGATFELIFNENGTIQFEYADVEFTGGLENPDCSGGACATIGLQNDTSLFNQFSAFEASVTDNSGILWTATDPQVFTATDSVTVNVGAPNIVVNDGLPVTGSVAEGATTTIPVPIANTGDRDLNWSINEAGPADRHFPQGPARVAKPLGDPSKSTLARAPIALRHAAKPGAQSHHAPSGGAAVPVFAADIYNNIIETFDALNPSVTNTITSTDTTAYVGGAFMDGDFSKMFAIAGNFSANPDDFFTIDTTTGAPTLIGSATNNLGEGYSGLAWDPVSGQLYAASGTCGSASHLWTIDPATGAPTAVGEITGVACVVGIAINSAGEMYAIDIVSDSLFAVDKSSGAGSLIGSVGFNMNYAQDMAFDLSTDTLYYAGFDGDNFTDQMYTLDLSTGLATPVPGNPNIGAGLGEVDAFSIETAGGPCSQPQDLPWLSFNPTSGTTIAGDTTNVSLGVDAAGSVEGDVLAGTMCTVSNDPDTHTVETAITVDVTAGGGNPDIVDSGIINLAVPSTIDGFYINWLTGCSATSASGCTGGTNFNPYNSGSGLAFFWPTTGGTNRAGVMTGTDFSVLASGATVGPASTWGTTTGGGNLWRAGADAYFGFRFDNANTGEVNYGYAHITSTGATGFPATLVEYWYNSAGDPITIP
jgi:hypothetical protein